MIFEAHELRVHLIKDQLQLYLKPLIIVDHLLNDVILVQLWSKYGQLELISLRLVSRLRPLSW